MPTYSREKKIFMAAVTRRFVKAVDKAIGAGVVDNDADLCSKIGLDKERMSEYRKQKSYVAMYYIGQISKLTGISTDWIIKGK